MSEITPNPETPARTARIIDPALKGKMPPGVAGIAMFLLFLTMVNAFAALHGAYGSGPGKLGILALCTLLVVGLLGLLRMRRWGWALVTGAAILLSAGYFYVFRLTHVGFFIVQGFFMLLFFLYLVRPEIRDRMV